MHCRHDGVGRGLFRRAALDLDDGVIQRIILHRHGDAVHHLRPLPPGYDPLADSADSITASAPSNTACATSRRLRRGSASGAVIMDSSIWVATTTGLPALRAARHDLLLQPRHPFQRHFHAQIAARHHQRVGQFQDAVQACQRLGLFDLGQHAGAALHDLFQFGHVLGPLHEAQRDPVHPQFQRRVQVGAILGRHRRHDGSSVSGMLTPLRSLISPATSTNGLGKGVGLGRSRRSRTLPSSISSACFCLIAWKISGCGIGTFWRRRVAGLAQHQLDALALPPAGAARGIQSCPAGSWGLAGRTGCRSAGLTSSDSARRSAMHLLQHPRGWYGSY